MHICIYMHLHWWMWTCICCNTMSCELAGWCWCWCGLKHHNGYNWSSWICYRWVFCVLESHLAFNLDTRRVASRSLDHCFVVCFDWRTMEPPVASPSGAKCGPLPGVDVYNPNLSIKDIFGDLSGGSLLDAIFATYQVGEKTRVKFFLDQNSTDHTNFPFHSRQVGIVRHQHNQRMHSGIKKAYVKSCCARGIVEGVRGEAWLTEPKPDSFGHRTGPFQALTYGSLCEAFFSALCQEPENQNLHRTLGRGLEARVFSHKLPDSIAKYIVKMHNRFHGGASTNFIELMQVVPDVTLIFLSFCFGGRVGEVKCIKPFRSITASQQRNQLIPTQLLIILRLRSFPSLSECHCHLAWCSGWVPVDEVEVWQQCHLVIQGLRIQV